MKGIMVIKQPRIDRVMLTRKQRQLYKDFKEAYVSMCLENHRVNCLGEGEELDCHYGNLVVKCDELSKQLPNEVVEYWFNRIDNIFFSLTEKNN